MEAEIQQTEKKQRKKETSLDEALEIVKAHLEQGLPFSNTQIDVCAEVVISMLPAHERDLAREVGQANSFPLWVVLLAQWRRCNEHGESFALLTDPDWEEKAREG